MTIPTPYGSAPFALSANAGGGPGVGQTAEQGLQAVIEAARTADQRGFHRFWMSEHHAMPALSIASPPLMIARLIAETRRIRLGAGGVMLPNHAPLILAEQFGMLDALAPGRIDLGLGRAPGTDRITASALRRGITANEEFPQQIDELLGFLHDDFPAGHAYSSVHAVPGPWQASQNRVPAPHTHPEIWMLGSSPYSALLAASLGKPYAFALQFGDADITTALRIYREKFKPSQDLKEPYSMVSVSTVVSEDARFARRQASAGALAMLRMFKRDSFVLLPPDEVESYPITPNERSIVENYTQRAFAGTAPMVAKQLEKLHQQTGADEIMLVLGGHDQNSASQTINLLADHYGVSKETVFVPQQEGKPCLAKAR